MHESINTHSQITVSTDVLFKVYKAVTKPEPYKPIKPIRKHYNIHLFG